MTVIWFRFLTSSVVDAPLTMLILGLIQSFCSAIVFWFREPRHLANRILTFWFVIFALLFGGFLLPGGLVAYTKIGFIPFFMLSGPVLYFYVRSLIELNFRFQPKDSWHLIPFAAVAVFRLIYFPESVSAETFEGQNIKGVIWGVIIMIVISIVLYWIATVLLLLRHRKNILNFFSDRSEKRTLNWVPLFMLTTLLSHILFFSGTFLSDLFPSVASMNFWLQQFNMALLGYLLLVFGLIQPIIFERKAGKPDLITNEPSSTEKYGHSGLKTEAMEHLAERIIRYLEEEKPFTNPEYNLQTMMQDLDLSQQHISQTINEQLGKNFYQLINEYRVQEFKHLLMQPESAPFTILSLAYAAGFNSKSSFNRVFKEITGQTPSQFQRSFTVDQNAN